MKRCCDGCERVVTVALDAAPVAVDSMVQLVDLISSEAGKTFASLLYSIY